MKKRYRFHLTIPVLAVAAILVSLYAFSPLNRERYRGIFERRLLPSSAITRRAVLDLKFPTYYIAGQSHDRIYLGNRAAAMHAIATNKSLTDSQHVKLKIKELASIELPKKMQLTVDSPAFFVTHGLMPGIFTGKVGVWEASRFGRDTVYFVEAVPTGDSLFALRSYSKLNKQFELAKIDADSPFFEFKYGLLEKQIDGVFCVDGALHFAPENQRLVYLYSYRNQYIVMDNDLKLLNRYNTIDTFSRAKIDVARIEDRNSMMMTGSPALINAHSCVSGEHLFIHSTLMGRGEDEARFDKAAVIDVYNFMKGEYLYSFYLERYNGQDLADFRASPHGLTAIFGRYLVVYTISDIRDLKSLSIGQE